MVKLILSSPSLGQLRVEVWSSEREQCMAVSYRVIEVDDHTAERWFEYQHAHDLLFTELLRYWKAALRGESV